MTPQWKDAVRAALAANRTARRFPKTQRELAAAMGAIRGTEPPDQSGISKMFLAESSALVDDICEVLGLDPPMVEHRVDPEVVRLVRELNDQQQRDVIRFIDDFILRRNSS